MKNISSIVLSLAIAFTASSAMAQAKKKSKAKAKTSSSKPADTLPMKEAPVAPGTEISPELTAPPPAATTPEPSPMTGPPDAAAPTTPADTKSYTPTTGSPHLFGLSAAVGLPHPIRVGFDYVHTSRIFSVGAAYGAFSLSASDVKLGINTMQAALRWHPFSGSFFIGALLGNHTISAEKTEVISGSSITGKLDVKANFAAPYMGWMWGGMNTGFFAGLDLGYLSPSGATSTFTSNASAPIQATTDYQRLESDIRKSGDAFGATGVPMFTLLKLGWMF